MICPGRGSTRQRGVLPHGLARGNVSVFRRASIASIALCLIGPLGGVANTAPPSPTTDLAVAAARQSDPVDYAHRGLPVHRSDADRPPAPPDNAAAPGEDTTAGDPVNLSTGLLVDTVTDLSIDDTIPISITRTYQHSDTARRAFGVGVGVGVATTPTSTPTSSGSTAN